VGQLGVGMQSLEGGHGFIRAVIHDYGVTFDVAEAFVPGFHVGVKNLFGNWPFITEREIILALLFAPCRIMLFLETAVCSPSVKTLSVIRRRLPGPRVASFKRSASPTPLI